MVFRAVQEKQQTSLLTAALTDLAQDLRTKPGNCITEEELVDTFKKVAVQVLPPNEMEKIFPTHETGKKVTRRAIGSQSPTRSKGSLSQTSSLAENLIPEA